MLRRILGALIFCLLTLAPSIMIAQAEFSAEVVDLQKAGTPAEARIYFTKDKMRVEGSGANPRGGGAVIVNLATQTSIVLMSQQHMYMEMPAQSQAQRLGFSYFRVGDVEDACRDWQQLAQNHGNGCHKVGNENVNGRSTVKYEGTNSSGDVSYFWLDSKLRFPVKWEGKSSKGEMRNIQEGAQPASLFEVPAGYTKMQLPAGMLMPGMQAPH
jgi:hypothetical protein